MKKSHALLTLLAIILICSCKKRDGGGGSPVTPTPNPTPTVTVPSVSHLLNSGVGTGFSAYVMSHDTIVAGGIVMSDGGAPVTAQGICWSTSPNPTIANSKTMDKTARKTSNNWTEFDSKAGGLTLNAKYYLRAYATNSAGTAYSSEISLTTEYIKGERFGGGIIVYLDQTKLHGLIATEYELTRAVWGTGTAGVYSTTDGSANTDKMIQAFGSSAVNVATVCRACRDGGYSDWFLPAINQLTLLGTPPNGFTYWSSTESNTNSSWAFVTTPPYGNTYGGEPKSIKHELRAMRAF